MSFGPLTELERDLCLLEDVVSDALDAWAIAAHVPVTPRSLERVRAALQRAHGVDEQLRDLRLAMKRLVQAADRERQQRKAS